MKKKLVIGSLVTFVLLVAALLTLSRFHSGIWPSRVMKTGGEGSPEYAGTQSCRECHEKFYKLWAPSHHGLAMQPFTPELFRSALAGQAGSVKVGDLEYRVEFDGRRGWVTEAGPGVSGRYPILHALGGKNVYYFLTSMERGRLQVLPLAYDVRGKNWFDMAASGIRHFRDMEEEPIGWRAQEFTFNTSCHGCHASQFTRNYDLKSDSYKSVWREPGINCEACHGSGAEHVRVCRQAGADKPPRDLRIVVVRPPKYSKKRAVDACSVCHAKASPLTASYVPGDDFFDHFDLGLLEHPDYYPDGRDLGENYTYTQWLMSPCAKSGELDCLHCHTSSGRFRFDAGSENQACLPCHADRVKNAAAHTHHPEGGPGSRCISCHMPMTEFARMRRSDHSMLPPTPALTIAYGSPNACNICHADKSAAWADGWVRKWRNRDYQAAVLHRASLVHAARQRDWQKLPAILSYLDSNTRDTVFTASLIRLLRPCEDDRKWPTLVRAVKDPSPLVRASAAESLGDLINKETFDALKSAVRDESRLVRLRAVSSLAAIPRGMLDPETAAGFDKAAGEFKAAVNARPDHWASHYNQCSFYLVQREYKDAVNSCETAIRLQPLAIQPYVHVAFAYNALGMNDKAAERLRKACEIRPRSVEANLNLGLLLGEMGNFTEAAMHLQKAIELDPGSAVAAYNLGLIHARMGKMDQAVESLRRARALKPDNPQYGYSLAFYLLRGGRASDAEKILQGIVRQGPPHLEAMLLLGEIYVKRGKPEEALTMYRRALTSGRFTGQETEALQNRISELLKK